MGACSAAHGGGVLTVYVLDSTVLIGYLRDTPSIANGLRRRLGEGHMLGTTCVNIAEVERGLKPAGFDSSSPTGRLPAAPAGTRPTSPPSGERFIRPMR